MVQLTKIVAVGVDVPVFHADPWDVEHVELVRQLLGQLSFVQTWA